MTAATIISTIGVCISAISVIMVNYFNSKNRKHTDTKDLEEQIKERAKDVEERTRERTELNVKLDFISANMQDIKEQISSLVKDVQNHGVKIAELEQSTRSAHHRLDSLEKKIDKKEDKE